MNSFANIVFKIIDFNAIIIEDFSEIPRTKILKHDWRCDVNLHSLESYQSDKHDENQQ